MKDITFIEIMGFSFFTAGAIACYFFFSLIQFIAIALLGIGIVYNSLIIPQRQEEKIPELKEGKK